MSIGPPVPEIQKLTLKIQGQGQITTTLHNYRSRKVHETLNWANPSSGFRDIRSAKSGPNLCQIWQVFGPWANPYGANGQMTMTVHNYRPRQFHRTLNGETRQAVTEIWVPQVWQPPTRPPAWTVTTIPLQPWGLRGKKELKKNNKKVRAPIKLTCHWRWQFCISLQIL